MHILPDIGANMCDTMYSGIYHGSVKHQPDIDAVLQRARYANVERIIITGTNFTDSKQALEFARNNG